MKTHVVTFIMSVWRTHSLSLDLNVTSSLEEDTDIPCVEYKRGPP